MTQPERKGVGNRIAPPRFLLFLFVLIFGIPTAAQLFAPEDWRLALLAAFDAAALCFLIAAAMLLKQGDADVMRNHAAANDANRLLMLVITVVVLIAILVTIGSLLSPGETRDARDALVVVISLASTWLFANTVFAMHYAHLYYLPDAAGDFGGLEFPGDDTPDYWDFLYFSFTLGMTFQTSDVTVAGGHMRRIVLLQSMAAFVFNIGILAFVINTLGGA
ncbi:DUF1345 domain-containing protein [Sphingomonas cavernae]|uniref:DUF1345 domain-containing protein n=1 Tax=Sphingomonas cavernae TaxID=2320861 RepID=A0A418WSC7_9SPHN|nr:DUF1345 domain-containing protein [Sphingomonas cavernae]RJF94125.1 DUF1345 domain-containing protein [Sphingomonas cavernae]